jgi:hypothetical protein
MQSNMFPLRQPPADAIVRAGSQSAGTGVSSKGTWLQQIVKGRKGCFVGDELEREALQGIYVGFAPHNLVWRMIHSAGQYGNDIVNLAPISDCGATNTFRAFLNSIM